MSPTIPLTCETPLHTIDALRDGVRLAENLGDETYPIRLCRLRSLLRDAETLNKLVSATYSTGDSATED